MIRFRVATAAMTACLAVVAVSCGGDDDAEEPMMDESTMVEEMVEGSMMEVAAMDTVPMTEMSMSEMTAGSEVPLAAWQTMPIVDVDGEEFTVADYLGRPVLVETFATWCSNCLAQLRKTQEAAAALGDDGVVLALSVETELSSADVAKYAADHGFDNIRFAVLSPELLAELADEFGVTVANPPATPKVIVDYMGVPGEMVTGPEAADDLVALMLAAGSMTGMAIDSTTP